MPAPPNDAEPPRTSFATLIAAGRMQEICDRAEALPPGAIDQEMLRILINAALAAGDAAARQRALDLAVEMRLAPGIRAIIVQRLAETGFDTEALAVMLADPAFPNALPARQKVVNAYVAISRGAASPLLRQAARAAVGRLLNRAPMVAAPSPLRLPPADPSAESLKPWPLALIPAGPAEAVDVRHFRAQADAFEALLRDPGRTQATMVRDVYVSRRGEIWDAEGRLLRDNRRLLPPESRAAMAAAPVFDDAVDGLDGTGNFFHWMTETLPSLAFAAGPGAPAWPVLLSQDAPRFAMDSLALAAPSLAGRVQPVGEAAFVRRLHIGSRRAADLRFWSAYETLFGPIVDQADALPAAPGDSDLLYLSRRDSTIRPMLNEAALEEALTGIGFRSVALGALPLPEQLRRVRRARMIVAPHGAALAHLLLARPGTTVVELMNSRDGTHHLTFCMARLSRLRGHRHAIWIQRGHPAIQAWSAQVAGVVATVREMLG